MKTAYFDFYGKPAKLALDENLGIRMFTHHQIWAAFEAFAEARGMSMSAFSKSTGLDGSSFNRSKRWSIGNRVMK
jgi:hypothetical protein